MESTRGRRSGGDSAPGSSPSAGIGAYRSAYAALVITIYIALAAGIFVCSGLAMVEYGVESEMLLSALLAISGTSALALTHASFRWRSPRTRPSLANARWTFWWVVLATLCLHLCFIVNQLGMAAVLLVVASALAEEMAFRRMPAECQTRAGLSGWGPTLVFACVTSAVFVVSHGAASVLPTIEKFVFGVCAYLICLWTRSILLPVALHLLGNATASVWVVHSGSRAGDWFSVCSVFVSLLALSGVTRVDDAASQGDDGDTLK